MATKLNGEQIKIDGVTITVNAVHELVAAASSFITAVSDTTTVNLTVTGTTLSGDVIDNTSTQKIIVETGGVAAGNRQTINFLGAGGISPSAIDNPGSDRVDITINTLMNTNKLIGRGTTGTGSFEEITLGTNLSLSGTTLNVTGAGVVPAALTRTDDTNVTLTLGGTPATALLQAVSLTLGWTGTLADARITSAATWNAKQATISVSSPITLTGASVGMVNQGTTSTVLHGNAAGNPSFGAIVAADITNGTLTQAKMSNYTARTFWGNNTAGAAAPTDVNLNFPLWQSVNSAWVTWTAGLAPSGTDISVYNWIQIGNMVVGEIRLFRGTSGTTVTNVVITFPTDFPTMTAPTGWTGASVHHVKVDGFTANGQNTALTNYTLGEIRRNAGDTAFEFNVPFTSQTLRGVWIKFTYFTS